MKNKYKIKKKDKKTKTTETPFNCLYSFAIIYEVNKIKRIKEERDNFILWIMNITLPARVRKTKHYILLVRSATKIINFPYQDNT